jgi:hypothetical protein
LNDTTDDEFETDTAPKATRKPRNQEMISSYLLLGHPFPTWPSFPHLYNDANGDIYSLWHPRSIQFYRIFCSCIRALEFANGLAWLSVDLIRTSFLPWFMSLHEMPSKISHISPLAYFVNILGISVGHKVSVNASGCSKLNSGIVAFWTVL